MRVLALILVLSACYPQNWGKRDQALENMILVTTAIDWYQTQGIVRNCWEGNPIIGECGERVSPNIYFPAVMVGQALISRYLLSRWGRGVFQGALLGAEVATTWDNHYQEDP